MDLSYDFKNIKNFFNSFIIIRHLINNGDQKYISQQTKDYTKYFVVIDKNDIKQEQEYFNDVINVVKPDTNSPAR